LTARKWIKNTFEKEKIMKLFTIFTERELKTGDEIVVHAPSIPPGASVVFKHQSDPLNPIARGTCVGSVEPLQTPTKGGATANVNRDYRKFEVTEEE